MQLQSLEWKALQAMFVNVESKFIEVVERNVTPAGFFTIIKLNHSILPLSQERERTWKFEHPSLGAGGFFVCWPVSDDELCLEAVANCGGWPPGLA